MACSSGEPVICCRFRIFLFENVIVSIRFSILLVKKDKLKKMRITTVLSDDIHCTKQTEEHLFFMHV